MAINFDLKSDQNIERFHAPVAEASVFKTTNIIKPIDQLTIRNKFASATCARSFVLYTAWKINCTFALDRL